MSKYHKCLGWVMLHSAFCKWLVTTLLLLAVVICSCFLGGWIRFPLFLWALFGFVWFWAGCRRSSMWLSSGAEIHCCPRIRNRGGFQLPPWGVRYGREVGACCIFCRLGEVSFVDLCFVWYEMWINKFSWCLFYIVLFCFSKSFLLYAWRFIVVHCFLQWSSWVLWYSGFGCWFALDFSSTSLARRP